MTGESDDQMLLTFGDPNVAAIEVEIEEPRDENWVFGHFRLSVHGESIGDWDDVVAIRAVVNWWRSFVSESVHRWDEHFEGLAAVEVFEAVHGAAYGDTAGPETEIDDAYGRFHINHLGMSAFDPYVVLLVEPPGRGQWLLWRQENGIDSVHEAHLPAGTLQALGAQLAAAVDPTGEMGIPAP